MSALKFSSAAKRSIGQTGSTCAVKYGADLNRRNANDETVLGYACSWGHLPIVQLLVNAGADVNAVEHDADPTFALHCTGLLL